VQHLLKQSVNQDNISETVRLALMMRKASLDEQACGQLFQRTLMEISQYDPVTAQKLAEAGYASTSSSSQ